MVRFAPTREPDAEVTPQGEGPTEEDLRKKPKKVRAKPGQRFAEQRRRAAKSPAPQAVAGFGRWRVHRGSIRSQGAAGVFLRKP